MFAQVYIVSILAVFAQSAFAATCSRSYTIAAGDYCDKISQEQNVSTYQLAVINPSKINKGCSNLVPGDSICLGFVGTDCSTTQVVKSGDTCSDIAASNGLNMTILRLNNPQVGDPCDIYVGEVLCTSKTVEVPDIPSSGITVTVSPDVGAPASTIIPNKTPSIAPSSTPIVADPATAAPATAAPSPTPTPSPTSTPSSTPTVEQTTPPKETDNADNGYDSNPDDDNPDDDDLPFCDEL
jgi:LysM repeat protein